MTHRRRWSDNDHNLGPFTYARDKNGRIFECILGSGDGDEYPGCFLRTRAFGHTLIVNLPALIRPWAEKIYVTTWDDATIKRLGRDWYWNFEEREYGVSYSTDMGGVGGGGFLQLYYGRCGMNGKKDERWYFLTPWNNWRHVRHSYYDLRGNHFWTEEPRQKPVLTGATVMQQGMTWEELKAKEDSVPTRTFCFTDFDGEFLRAKTRIEERQWELGTGWFKWLSWFRKPIIQRTLDIEFSGETGKRKGSWKGGTMGTGIGMRPGELHMDAFIRYREEHDMTYKGVGIWIDIVYPTPEAGKELNDTGTVTDPTAQSGRG